MAASKRKRAAQSPEWKEDSVPKRAKTSEAGHDKDNYETAASQRPRRMSKRLAPSKVAQQARPKKAKQEPRKGPPRSKKAQTPGETKAKLHATRSRGKKVIDDRTVTQTDIPTADVSPAAQTQGNKSLIVTLKAGWTQTSEEPPTEQTSHIPDTQEADNGGSAPYFSLQSQNLIWTASLPDQCAQPRQIPVPANSQDAIVSNVAAVEHVRDLEELEQSSATPRGILTGHDTPEHLETPQPASSQTPESFLAPLTPDSIHESTLRLRLNLKHPQQVVTAPLRAIDDVSDVDSEATTEYEDAVQDSSEDSISDEQIRLVAAQLFAHRKPSSAKSEPIGQPEVWADGRQELCETLHFFRAYQSSCYSTGGFVRGFMFDNVAHARDYIDSNVVISRAGGGLTKDKTSGDMKAGRDQVEDTAAKGLRNCMSHLNPVVIITGADNPSIPSKPPHQYCVLDYFKPTHIWTEKTGGRNVVRYRFEKLNTKKVSWWHPKDTSDPVQLGSLPPPILRNCSLCHEQSPQIYLNGWMCLQPTCKMFWKIVAAYSSSNLEAVPFEPNEASLKYDPRFLKQRTPWHNDDHDYPLVSNAAELSGYSIPGEDTSQAFWLGMVCPDCGRCNSRLDWMGWQCQNTTCNFKKEPPHTLIPASSLREPLWPLNDSYTLSRDTHSSLVDVHVSFAHGYRINQYTIPGINGFIAHMIANRAVVSEPGGPDAMFEELQQTDIGLKRRSMPNGQLKGPNYCRHFAVNYGMPYKFIAATASHPFAGAARPITATRSRLNWAARLLLSQAFGKSMEETAAEWKTKEFNEVLALGYFEAQKINYHDDGEHGLGPTIATLSLGAPGSMRIRMKARHHHGVSSSGIYDDAPPLPSCHAYNARLALHPALTALKQSDPKAYHTRRKQIPKEIGLKAAGNARDVLNMQLGHGDVVLMHGAELQRYYEHAVEHKGKLRFALTCRYIDGESLAEGERPGYVVEGDGEGYDGSQIGG